MMADSFMTEETHTARPYFITTTNSANKLKLQNENLNKAGGFQNPLSQKFYLLADFTQLKTIIKIFIRKMRKHMKKTVLNQVGTNLLPKHGERQRRSKIHQTRHPKTRHGMPRLSTSLKI